MLSTVVEEGRTYELELSWGKLVQMQIYTSMTRPYEHDITTLRDAVHSGWLQLKFQEHWEKWPTHSNSSINSGHGRLLDG
eukprot:2219859-Pyramimonas_sp.AAC.1